MNISTSGAREFKKGEGMEKPKQEKGTSENGASGKEAKRVSESPERLRG